MTSEIDMPSMLLESFLASIPNALKITWPIWVFLFVSLVVRIVYKIYKLKRLSKAGMNEIDKMDGQAFEEYLTNLFRNMGYSVRHVGSYHGDYGADLIVSKNGKTIAVQVKRHKSYIGVDAVREALGSIKMYKCNGAMVVTNSYFTRQAKRLARVNGVELWDRNVLVGKILEFID
ncbi:restriction endonuclease [Candidatus Woesebacteria bacterium]|nr:MAG: restriction endonuclease [Candidatus Woesebacteria bacterium]